MKISAIKLYILEDAEQPGRALELIRVPNLLRIQYTHRARPGAKPARQHFLEVQTDEGSTGRVTANLSPHQVEILRDNVVGMDAFHREAIFQKLQKGTRWVYQPPGWFGDLDNCLWDILGKATGRPIYDLVGRVRVAIPAYLTGGDGSTEDYLAAIEHAQAMGIRAYKFHTYKGGKADIPIFHAVREAVGPDYALINDPVCSYSLREAIEIGRVMEELDFVWLEEPFHEQKMHHYQELCAALTMPVMANEMLMHDMGLSAQWLIHGATDRLRANARHGATQVLKLAHFAELYGANIELNGQGGLFGLVHTHLACCIDNTDYYEYMTPLANGMRTQGERWGLLNAPVVEDGMLTPPSGPGWGAEWDEEVFASRIVATHGGGVN